MTINDNKNKILMGIIYMATNKTTGKCYIGQTIKKLKNRKLEHFSASKNLKFKYKFCNAIRKYGFNDFDWETLYDNVPINMLNSMESLCIDMHNTFFNGYNSTTGGENGKQVSEETKKKISISETGKYVSIETKNKLSKCNVGKKQSNETKQKRSASMSGEKHFGFGKHLTDDHKRKISENHVGNTGKFFTKEHRDKLSNAHKGKHLTDDHKNKISLSKKGFLHTEESKQKMSKNHADMRGERSGQAKLTWEIVSNLRALYETKNYTYSELSKIYNISCSTISFIINNKTWKI